MAFTIFGALERDLGDLGDFRRACEASGAGNGTGDHNVQSLDLARALEDARRLARGADFLVLYHPPVHAGVPADSAAARAFAASPEWELVRVSEFGVRFRWVGSEVSAPTESAPTASVDDGG